MSVHAAQASVTESRASGVNAAPNTVLQITPAQVGQTTPCFPFTATVTTVVTTPIPAACLPVPEEATVACPTDITFSCTVGTPTTVAPGEVSVPVTIQPSAHTLFIRNEVGVVVCTIDVTNVTPSTVAALVSCPVTTGVACSCTLTNPVCLGCTFDETRTQIICTFTNTLTLSCASFPTPTEIDCILVDKVFDFCFEEDTGLQNCVAIPPQCLIPPAGSTATCTITSVQCTTGSPVPTGVDGLATVRVTLTTVYDTVIRNAAGVALCELVGSVFTFTKTVTVCAPTGVTASCEVRAATCGPCVILPATDDAEVMTDGFPRGQVCCEFNFCVLVETTAPVKLLVPTFGFCVPVRCQTGGFPPGVCPPSPLFPPQCTGFVG